MSGSLESNNLDKKEPDENQSENSTNPYTAKEPIILESRKDLLRLARRETEYDKNHILLGTLPEGFISKSRYQYLVPIENIRDEKNPHECLYRYFATKRAKKVGSFSTDDALEVRLSVRACSFVEKKDGKLLFEGRERILVNSKDDEKLKRNIDEYRKKCSESNQKLSDYGKLECLFDYLRDLCFNRYQPINNNEFGENFSFGFQNPQWNLGDIPETGHAACRHIQLFGKVLGEAEKLNISLQRGRIDVKFTNGKKASGAHAWLICQIEGTYYLFDPNFDPKNIKKIVYKDSNGHKIMESEKGKKLYNSTGFL
ncbi:MAG: hypothetical protein P1V18_00345 [Candidatus Gracilibacteria bacterium]|nr:hypothetical protein [Candidatus Gracilibacteria bacterium]